MIRPVRAEWIGGIIQNVTMCFLSSSRGFHVCINSSPLFDVSPLNHLPHLPPGKGWALNPRPGSASAGWPGTLEERAAPGGVVGVSQVYSDQDGPHLLIPAGMARGWCRYQRIYIRNTFRYMYTYNTCRVHFTSRCQLFLSLIPVFKNVFSGSIPFN